MKMGYQETGDATRPYAQRRRGDGARDGGGRGRGIIVSDGSRGQDAKGRGGRGANGRNTFGGICYNCGQRGHIQGDRPDNEKTNRRISYR